MGSRKDRQTPEDLLRRENARLRRKLSYRGAFGELLVDAVKEAYSGAGGRVPRPRLGRRKREEEVAVAMLSDTQIGKTTATYDSEIAARRVVEYAERVATCVERHRSYATVDELHLYLGGDMVEGELIFPHQAHEIDQSVFEQAVRTAPATIAEAIRFWLSLVRVVHVVAVAGNHGRPASRYSGSHPETNWDRVCYDIVRLMLRDEPRVTWNVPDSWYAVDEVLGHRNLLVHGHQIRGGFAGFPWYGVGKKLTGWIDAIPESWDALYFGHFHTYTKGEMNSRPWYCNGTLESDNDYAREELAASGRPKQLLHFYNAKHGLVADRPIHLTYGLGG